MTDPFDLIAAFADGEPVAAEELKAALADPAGRDYLIDLLALRGFVNPEFVATTNPTNLTNLRNPRNPKNAWRLTAAALLVAGLGGGYLAGRDVTIRQLDSRPPIVSLAPSAPAPTHVIRMEDGVNWNEK